MDIEFHYHMTWLIAARAGFPPEDAEIIATSSQYVDDNAIIFEIDKDGPAAYSNYISQTMNILKPKPKLFRIYPVFHFIPGDPTAQSAWRKDGQMHWLNTTPNSANANRILDAALQSEDLHRIGIACHGYTDTWAHQNFTGYFNGFNSMTSPLSAALPNIGHAEAMHAPDWPALVWKDRRLIMNRVDNRRRFLYAAIYLFDRLAKHVDPQIPQDTFEKRALSLEEDLNRCIGERDQTNAFRKNRIKEYQKLAETPEYGRLKLKEYDPDSWLEQAVNENVRGIQDRTDTLLARWDPWTDIYTWKDPENYMQTHWYRFQEAVKQHQEDSLAMLLETNLKGLQLPEL